MKQISMRVPEEFDVSAGRLSKLGKEDKSDVYRKAVKLGIDELRKRAAVELYKSGKVTLSEACTIAELGAGDMMEELVRQGVRSRVTLADLEEGRKLAARVVA